jgi:hypothetical protein
VSSEQALYLSETVQRIAYAICSNGAPGRLKVYALIGHNGRVQDRMATCLSIENSIIIIIIIIVIMTKTIRRKFARAFF